MPVLGGGVEGVLHERSERHGGPAVQLSVLVAGDYDGLIDLADPEVHLTATRVECARLARLFRAAAAKPEGEATAGSAEAIALVDELDRHLVAGSAFFAGWDLDENLGRVAEKATVEAALAPLPEVKVPEESEFWANLKSFVGVFGPLLLVFLLGRGLVALLRDLVQALL